MHSNFTSALLGQQPNDSPKPIIITLDTTPLDAPNAIKVISGDGRSILFKSVCAWPALAQTFGWSVASIQAPGHGFESEYYRPACGHRRTDGTTTCPDCGLSADTFITAARTWLNEHDGAQAEDPGYFETEPEPPSADISM